MVSKIYRHILLVVDGVLKSIAITFRHLFLAAALVHTITVIAIYKDVLKANLITPIIFAIGMLGCYLIFLITDLYVGKSSFFIKLKGEGLGN
jgi:hypothetical protein